ncbi:hypothetical protein H1230_12325 [Paenibacillus sp. 19GGS1-52]|uniref:hypothetical protein n=1 Tax=Paenibacillus sp. 19GGS1-52 TaxID=2758563 RepID=UPI001EFC2592|nr:hypothetical protein [Paenibacillus sp. 19GGS1-52]ULO09486.1 hypothetical protein H1230_12325 [Paenibacillus sp. 19GGS1-52]
MRKIGINILIICLYCFPFVYFSMYKDFNNSSMVGYLMMVIITSIAAMLGNFYNKTVAVLIGNLASPLISGYFINMMIGNERWAFFFKPFTPLQLLILVSFINLIPQLIVFKLTEKLKHT